MPQSFINTGSTGGRAVVGATATRGGVRVRRDSGDATTAQSCKHEPARQEQRYFNTGSGGGVPAGKGCLSTFSTIDTSV